MNIAVVGGRDFNDYQLLEQILFSSVAPEGDKIISGGAKGADTLARQFAVENTIPFQEINADWASFGKQAGRIRNAEIVAQSDMVVAFWDGKSKGTKHTIDLAHEKGLTVLVINYVIIEDDTY